MNQRQKKPEQLKNDLSLKIKGINNLLAQALKYDLESNDRLEISNIIASSLRAILVGDNHNHQSLIKRVGYDKKLFFPLYDPNICLNLFPTYNLLQFSINKDGVKVNISEDLFKTGGMWGMYLTYESWLNEVVIDTKLQNVEPLSRLLIIKCVADTAGAHVDNDVEEHLFEMSKHDLLPVVLDNGVQVQRDLEVKAKSIFCETILAIAKELINSYEIRIKISPKIIGPSGTIVRVQKYATVNNRYELVKYGTIEKNFPYQTNTYNSNSYYECDVYAKEASLFDVVINKRRFKVRIINYQDVILCDYLGKSIYQNNI